MVNPHEDLLDLELMELYEKCVEARELNVRLDAAHFFNSMDEVEKRIRNRLPCNEERAQHDIVIADAVARHKARLLKG